MKHLATFAPKYLLLCLAFLPLRAHGGTSYYVSLEGSDANDGLSLATPFRKVQKFLDTAVAGDTCFVREGIYNDGFIRLRSKDHVGTSWSNPIILKPYKGEPVVLKNSGEDLILDVGGTAPLYWIIDGIIFDGSNGYHADPKTGQGLVGGGGSYLRLQNCEIKNGVRNGILAGGSHWEFLNCDVHHNGHDPDADAYVDGPGHSPGYGGSHGIYWFGQNLLIDGGKWHDNYRGNGLQIFGSGHNDVDDNVVRNARIYNNASTGFNAGMIMATGHRNIAYNNLIYHNGPGRELQFDYRGTDCAAYNNTIVPQKGVTGISVGNGSNAPGNQAVRTVLKNNLIYTSGNAIWDLGSDTVKANNFTSGNPAFTDAAGADFTLLSDSPARGGGLNLTALGITALVRDFSGTARPASGAWDIGAYQYGSHQ